MKKKKSTASSAVLLMPLARRVLHIGLLLIGASLLRLLFEVQSAAPFTPGAAAYFGALLEYPVASLALLTGATLLLDRAERAGN
ncbi:MAG: hypothetical protein IJY22_01420 [Clostridia bacterium]|nr:hypothetical protein [Clostridia bacterium]